MALIGMAIPHETARLLSGIEVPGEPESQESLHITILYLGDAVPMDVVARAMTVTYDLTSRVQPFTLRTSLVTCFPKGDDGVPIICRIESPALHSFRAELVQAFDDAGIEYNSRFPEYKPHVTLAYSPEPIREERIPTVEWGAHEAVLWAGDHADGRLTITFPFSLKVPKIHSVAPEEV